MFQDLGPKIFALCKCANLESVYFEVTLDLVGGHPVLKPDAVLKAAADGTLVRLIHHHGLCAKINLNTHTHTHTHIHTYRYEEHFTAIHNLTISNIIQI